MTEQYRVSRKYFEMWVSILGLGELSQYGGNRLHARGKLCGETCVVVARDAGDGFVEFEPHSVIQILSKKTGDEWDALLENEEAARDILFCAVNVEKAAA